MGKNNITNYFSHDSNARNSDKIIRLRMRHKSAGYGVYFMILERLREEPSYMSVKDYNMIAFDLREDASLIKSVVEDFGLFVFTEDGKYFYSESFKRRMEIKDEKNKKRSEAGKIGVQKRWDKQDKIANDGETIANATKNDSKRIANGIENDSKKRKEKESKEISPDGDTKKGEPSGSSLSPVIAEHVEKELSECRSMVLSDRYWMETVCMNEHLTPETFTSLIEEFFKTLQNRGELRKSVRDAKHHFASWLKIELKNRNNHARDRSSISKNQASETGYGEE